MLRKEGRLVDKKDEMEKVCRRRKGWMDIVKENIGSRYEVHEVESKGERVGRKAGRGENGRDGKKDRRNEI